jgi:hypothetical protein
MRLCYQSFLIVVVVVVDRILQLALIIVLLQYAPGGYEQAQIENDWIQ